MASEDILQSLALSKLIGGGVDKSIVSGLFGLPPDMIAQQEAQQQLQSSRNEAMNFAQLDPFQRANYMMYQGGSGLSSGLLGAIGPDSAAVTQAKAQQAVTQELQNRGININTPQGYLEASKVAQSMGQPSLAAKFSMAGAQLDKELATAEKARFIEANKMADLGVYNKYLSQFKGDTAAAGEAFNKYKQDQEIAQRVAGRNITTVNMAPYEKQFDIKRADLDIDTIKDYRVAARAAAQELPNLNRMDELAQSNKLYTGPISDFKIKGAEFLISSGLASPDQVKKVSNSREFESAASAGVLARIKKLGINPTDADREFATRMGAMLASNPASIVQVNGYMRTRALDTIKEAQRIQAHADKYKNLVNYNFNPEVTIGGTEATPVATPKGGLKSFYINAPK